MMSTPSSPDLGANSSFDPLSTPLLPEEPSTDGASTTGDAPSLMDGSLPESPHPRPNYLFLVVIALLNLAADMGTKHWAEVTLQTPSQIPLPKSIFKTAYAGFGFMLARNRGGAWGLLHSYEEKFRKPFFITVSVLAILFIVSLYRKLHPSQRALRWGLPLVLGGALGNLVDRIRYGHVIDFIDFYAIWGGGQHHWPTFNVADISICVGVGLMAVDMLTTRHAPPAMKPSSEPPVSPVISPSDPPVP